MPEVDGRYRLETMLGRGGMGEVWRAADRRLGRQVAVKLLPADQAAGKGEAVARFHREARVMAALQHPGIVQVFDSGEQDGRLYLVMELLDGQDLRALLREHPTGLPLPRAVDLAARIADALASAHAADIVHRDIKPANVMVLADDRVKVCDFGLAGHLRTASALTAPGVIMGTPEYMAPEQCRGLRVDGRADLYALGCVLFALLTGRPPFPARGDAWAVMLEHLYTPPPSLTALRPDVPAQLALLTAQLLAKDPDDRPLLADDVAERLRAASLDHAHPQAGPGYRIEVFQNEYLAPDAVEANAILTLTAPARETAVAAPRALVFLIGLSTALPEEEFRASTEAVARAVDDLDESARFAVIAGSRYAGPLYPDTLRLVRATPAAKAAARTALASLEPVREAAFGRWIRTADRLLSGHADAVRTAVLLMDMRDEAESPEELAAALASSSGRFTCHVRGLGTAWEVSQGNAVARALGGTVDIVALPSQGLARELAEILEGTRRATARELALRIIAPDGVRVRRLMRVAPTMDDLTGRGHVVGNGVREYRTDVPDGHTRDYHLQLDLAPGRARDAFTAAEVELVDLPPTGDGEILARAQVQAVRDGPG
ncbi:protein kinase [Kitasatospora sp. NPDC101155]|uniref:serine/threonine-protein kinase n=1 Tax=Kitasatospora sp. NPDC101155 TaxID=3364097 RepID=UPI0037FFCC10